MSSSCYEYFSASSIILNEQYRFSLAVYEFPFPQNQALLKRVEKAFYRDCNLLCNLVMLNGKKNAMTTSRKALSLIHNLQLVELVPLKGLTLCLIVPT